jgi:hypothetical protein
VLGKAGAAKLQADLLVLRLLYVLFGLLLKIGRAAQAPAAFSSTQFKHGQSVFQEA